MTIGAASAHKATMAGQYSVIVTSDGAASDHEYSFASDTAVYRHVSRSGAETIEFHERATQRSTP